MIKSRYALDNVVYPTSRRAYFTILHKLYECIRNVLGSGLFTGIGELGVANTVHSGFPQIGAQPWGIVDGVLQDVAPASVDPKASHNL